VYLLLSKEKLWMHVMGTKLVKHYIINNSDKSVQHCLQSKKSFGLSHEL